MLVNRCQLILLIVSALICRAARAETQTYVVDEEQSLLTKWGETARCREGCSFAVTGLFDAELDETGIVSFTNVQLTALDDTGTESSVGARLLPPTAALADMFIPRPDGEQIDERFAQISFGGTEPYVWAADGQLWMVNLYDNSFVDGPREVLDIVATAVPEPGGRHSLMVGFGMLLCVSRCRSGLLGRFLLP